MEKKQPFEESIKRLQKIVEELSSGKLTLSESLKKYEEGLKLAKECAQQLEEAERRVELLMKKNGSFARENFSEEEEEQ